MLQGFTGVHALVILAVVVLLFGATKLPALARSVGQSMKIFKNEVKSDDPAATADPVAEPVTQPRTTEPTRAEGAAGSEHPPKL